MGLSTTVLGSAAAVVIVLDGANGFLAFPSGRGITTAGAVRFSSLRKTQHRARPRSWMCESKSPAAATRRDLVQAAGAAIAAASTLSIADLNDVAVAAAEPTSRSAGAVTNADRKGVEATTVRWKDTVTMGTPEAPRKTADLYAMDGVLWGTVSEEVRDTPEEIYDYFDYFARLPKLRLSEYTPVSVRVYGDFATQAGTYTFKWQGADGETKEKRARFSFTFRRDPDSPTAWTIVEHHSSSMPTSPAELKHVRISGTAVF